jgi:DNA-binding LacI/PurR family transcriptional regulator
MPGPGQAVRPDGRRATARDVAAAAGVSRTAVSFAFNDPARISAATRKRILQVADDLGYRPDTVARMLSHRRTGSLGVLLPQGIPEVMENPYYAQFLVGLGQVCQQEGLTLLLVPPLRDSMLKAIPYAAVDGFVVCGLEVDRGEVAELNRRGIPFVLVDSEAPEEVPSVDVADEAGAEAMMAHLLELGHRRIAILAFEAGPDREQYGYRGPLGRRLTGISRALEAAGMSLDHPTIELIEARATKSAGFEAAHRLLARPDPPTALFALSDILAMGALDAAYELGFAVPDQVSVAGFDDQPEAAWVRPRLTTVRQAVETKGRVAGDFLVAAIRGQSQHPHQLLQATLVVRESTGPARILTS